MASRYQRITYSFYHARYHTNALYKLALALAFAGLTGLGAQLRIPLPFTPVPITGQVFFVLLSGVALGRWGGMSQLLYVMLGGIGLPWFAGFSGGFGVIAGVTGGYLLGFIAAAYLVGWFTDRLVAARRLYFQLFLMLAGISVIYALGAVQLSLVLKTGFQDTLIKAIVPFIPGDIIKAVAVAAVGSALTPKASYDGEIDVKQPLRVRGLHRKLALPGLGLLAFFFLLFVTRLLSIQTFGAAELFDVLWYAIAIAALGLLILNFLFKSPAVGRPTGQP